MALLILVLILRCWCSCVSVQVPPSRSSNTTFGSHANGLHSKSSACGVYPTLLCPTQLAPHLANYLQAHGAPPHVPVHTVRSKQSKADFVLSSTPSPSGEPPPSPNSIAHLHLVCGGVWRGLDGWANMGRGGLVKRERYVWLFGAATMMTR